MRGFVKEFGEKYSTAAWKILFCKLCEVKVTAEKRFTVQQHCNTAKHKSCINREFAAESRQRLLFEKSHSSSSILGSACEFSKDLCKMMVSPNSPLHKVEAASFRKFLEKYTTHPIIILCLSSRLMLHCAHCDSNDKFCIHLWISGMLNKRIRIRNPR